VVTGLFANPSLAHPLCKRFVATTWQQAKQRHNNQSAPVLDESGAHVDPRLHSLAWVRLEGRDGTNVTCYPEADPDSLLRVNSMWDQPYRHGWCTVCKSGLLRDCMPEHDKG
jgi:hypothetical protein